MKRIIKDNLQEQVPRLEKMRSRLDWLHDARQYNFFYKKRYIKDKLKLDFKDINERTITLILNYGEGF